MRAMVDSEAMYFGEVSRRGSLQPPSKLNEAMLFTSNGSWLRPVLPSDRPVSRNHSINRMHCFFIFVQMHEANWLDLGVSRVVTAAKVRAKEARTLRETLPARFVQYSSQLNEASAKISARTTSGQTFSNLQTFTNEYGHKKSFAVTQLYASR